jgi:endonuclease-3
MARTPRKAASKKSKESQADRKERALKICRVLEKTYSDAVCALHHKNPFELLVATILSAQCTDARVNATTPELFQKYPNAKKLAASKQEDVEAIIRPLGFFRAKATNIRGMAQGLVDQFEGDLPRTLDELVSLPGVGRKTANVVLGTAFDMPTGVVVDTHVRRITRLLALTTNMDPVKIERDIMDLLPEAEWINFSHRLIHHGRRICIARRPKCTECPLLPLCPRVGLPPLESIVESE